MHSSGDALEESIRKVTLSDDVKKPSVNLLLQQEYLIRLASIQTWFLRCSSNEKYNFIVRLYDRIKQTDEIAVWYNILMENCVTKLIFYSYSTGRSFLVFDNSLMDNNRTLDPKVLRRTIEEDIEWYLQFDEDLQAEIFGAFCRMSGTALFRRLLKYMQKTFHAKPNFFGKRSYSISTDIASACRKRSQEYIEIFDFQDPVVNELMQKRNEWNENLAKYKRDIDSRKKHKAAKKVGKNKKKSKSSKSTKSTKSEGAAKVSAEVDYIQVMPIWLVLKIFSYLDKKTLKKIKPVNSYWSFAVGALEKELKARKALDKTISKLRKTLDIPKIPRTQCVEPKIATHTNKFEKLLLEGTCCKRIRDKLNKIKATNEHTAFENCIDKLKANVHFIESFPRKETDPREVYTLFKNQRCIKYEGGKIVMPLLSELKDFGDIPVFQKIEIGKAHDSVSSLDEVAAYSGTFVDPEKDIPEPNSTFSMIDEVIRKLTVEPSLRRTSVRQSIDVSNILVRLSHTLDNSNYPAIHPPVTSTKSLNSLAKSDIGSVHETKSMPLI